MNVKYRFAFLSLACFCACHFLSGCGGGEEEGPKDISIEEVTSAYSYENDSEETKFRDFSLVYYADKGGFLVGDYRGDKTSIVIPDEATDEDGVVRPIVGLSDNAFYGRQNLKTVVFGKNLRYIGRFAFSKSGVTDLRVSYGIGHVDPDAFANSDVPFYEWKNIKYLPSLNNRYSCAFFNSSSFDALNLVKQTETLLFPVGIKEINTWTTKKKLEEDQINYYYAKEHLRFIKAVGLPDGLEHVEGFMDWTSLEHVTLPNTLKKIGLNAFQNCYSLTSITIPDSVTSMMAYAFQGCGKLETVILSPNMSGIPEYAFKSCSSLKTINIPEGIGAIADYAFSGCSLESIGIPSTLRSVGNGAFDGCPGKFFTEYEGVVYFGQPDKPYVCVYKTTDNLPEILKIHPDCSSIPSDTLKVGGQVKEVIIPAGINISMDGIRGSVSKITFLGTPTFISGWAFEYCKSLTFVSYDAARYLGNEENPYMILYDVSRTSITSIKIHPDCTAIAGHAFEYCKNLASVTIPSKVERICDSAFCGIPTLRSVNIQNAPAFIGDDAFYGNSALSSVSLGNAVKAIGKNAFEKCAMASISIPASCEKLSKYSFFRCSALTNVTVAGPITSIPEHCFDRCAFSSFAIPSTVTEIKAYAFADNKALKSIYIPASVENIAKTAFSNCTALTNVYAEATERPSGWYTTFNEATVTYGYRPS